MKLRNLIGALAALCLAGVAHAQAPTVTLTGTPLSGPGPVTTQLVWSSTNAVSCTASGGWAGAKATSGTEAVSGIVLVTTFTLTCSGAAQSQATITWAPPTQRTDDSPILGALSYNINYGLGAAFDRNLVPNTSPSYTITGLAPGSYQFRMTATEAGGSTSAVSNVVAKVVAAAQTAAASVTVSPIAPPKPPVVLTVIVADAFQVIYDRRAKHYNVGNQFGTATIGAPGVPDPVLGDGYCALADPVHDSKPWKGYRRTKIVAAKCAEVAS